MLWPDGKGLSGFDRLRQSQRIESDRHASQPRAAGCERPVASIQKALQVNLRVYPTRRRKRTFFAPDTDPVLNLSVPVLHISGLDNFALPRPRLQASLLRTGQKSPQPNAGSGPSGNYMGNDFGKPTSGYHADR